MGGAIWSIREAREDDARLIAGLLAAFAPPVRVERLRVADSLFACGGMRILCRYGQVIGFCGVIRPKALEFQIVIFVADGLDQGAAAAVYSRLRVELLSGMEVQSICSS
jgi:hypothetical protein